MSTYNDLVIIGSGSTAFSAASRAANLGKTAAMVESRTLGGTCVNRGCLPSKNLIEAAAIYWDSRHPRYPGLQPAPMELAFRQLIGQKDQVIRDYRDRKYSAIVARADRITVYEGHAAFVAEHTVDIGGQQLEGEQFLIATGTRPAIPPIRGLDQVPYLTSDLLTSGEPLELFELPESLIVIGGGYVALELGQMFHRFGTQVTLLERSPRVLPAYEPEVSWAIAELLQQEDINLVTHAQAQEVNRAGQEIIVTAQVRGDKQSFRAKQLLVATGRVPNTEGIELETVGVETNERGFVRVDDYLRTSVPHIWAAGDVIGSHTDNQMATPVGAHDGAIAAANALNGALRKVDHRVIPRVIFTDPPVAVVGLTDKEANALGYHCRCNTVSMEHVPRAGIRQDTRGLIKMVMDIDTEQVLGVSMVGHNAGEVIHEAAMALRFGATAHDFIDLIHVYPTMAEALKIAALSFYTDVEELSCCAEG